MPAIARKNTWQEFKFSNETVDTLRQRVQPSACFICFGRACLKLRIEVDTSGNLPLHLAVSEILEPLAKCRRHITWEHNGSDTRTLISCGPTDRVPQICIWSWDLTVELTVQQQAQKINFKCEVEECDQHWYYLQAQIAHGKIVTQPEVIFHIISFCWSYFHATQLIAKYCKYCISYTCAAGMERRKLIALQLHVFVHTFSKPPA